MKYIEDDEWHHRKESSMPYQVWRSFHPDALVEIKHRFDDIPKIGVAYSFDWGYHSGLEFESTILIARHVYRNGKPVYRVKVGNART